MKKGLLVLLFTLCNVIYSQGFGSVGAFDPISSGMGNNYTTFLNGTYAVGKNPANIILERDDSFEIATVFPIPNVSVFAGTDFINLDDINYFFGGVINENGERVGRYLTASDKDRLKALFDKGGIVSGTLTATLFNIVINAGRNTGTFGFSINENIASFTDLPESIVDLAFEGNPVGTEYNLDGSKMNAIWMRDYTVSYARDFREVFRGFRNFYIGVSLRFVQGFALVKSDYIETSFVTEENGNIVAQGDFRGYAAFSKDFNVKYDFDSEYIDNGSNFSAFPSPAGKGLGLDFGISAKINDKFDVGIALTGLGKIKWNTNVAEYTSDAVLIFDDLTDSDVVDSLVNEIKGDGRYIDEITTELPSVFRVGAAVAVHNFFRKGQFPGTLTTSLEYNQGLNNTAIGSTKPRFSIGAEWRPLQTFPIRTGFSFGGRFGFAWSLGAGVDLGLFEFNISAYNFTSFLVANKAETVALAMGSRWKF